MKSGDTVRSAKDRNDEILVLRGENLYGNRTGFNYGKMEDNETPTENKKENSDVLDRLTKVEERLDALESTEKTSEEGT